MKTIGVALLFFQVFTAHAGDRLTVLTDAFGRDARLDQDWGYAALIEIGGKRILFDTGNDAAMFERNVRRLGIDLRRLDFVVISHRHGDHTAGLHYLRRVNPKVRIYAPRDEHFGGPTPAAFFRPDPSLPRHMRYFRGEPPQVVPHGTAWGNLSFIQVEATTEVTPGVRLVPAVSEAPGMRDLRELALIMETPAGQIVVVGCSHPGVESVLQSVTRDGASVRLLAGGFHWVTMPVPEIQRMAKRLRDEFRVGSVAPGHCTGEAAFKELQAAFGDDYIYAGVGTVIPLK